METMACCSAEGDRYSCIEKEDTAKHCHVFTSNEHFVCYEIC
jgi:hypothetical protein